MCRHRSISEEIVWIWKVLKIAVHNIFNEEKINIFTALCAACAPPNTQFRTSWPKVESKARVCMCCVLCIVCSHSLFTLLCINVFYIYLFLFFVCVIEAEFLLCEAKGSTHKSSKGETDTANWPLLAALGGSSSSIFRQICIHSLSLYLFLSLVHTAAQRAETRDVDKPGAHKVKRNNRRDRVWPTKIKRRNWRKKKEKESGPGEDESRARQNRLNTTPNVLLHWYTVRRRRRRRPQQQRTMEKWCGDVHHSSSQPCATRNRTRNLFTNSWWWE